MSFIRIYNNWITITLVAILLYSCNKAPTESELLSSDFYGNATLRATVFGVLTPGDSLQKIMIEDSRNNLKDFYQNTSYMRFTGQLGDDSNTYGLWISNIRVMDPFQVPETNSIYSILDAQIQEALIKYQDTLTAEYYFSTKLALATGLTRSSRWLSTDSVTVKERSNYRFNLELEDSRYPDIKPVIRDSTAVPGSFDITYPTENAIARPVELFQLRWTKSQNAAGYRIIASTPANKNKRFDTLVMPEDVSLTISMFFNESASYKIQIWALDDNYFNFLKQSLAGQRVNRTHFFDYGEMNLSALVVFGSRVMRSVEFAVECVR